VLVLWQAFQASGLYYKRFMIVINDRNDCGQYYKTTILTNLALARSINYNCKLRLYNFYSTGHRPDVCEEGTLPTHQYYASLERLERNKHPSLLLTIINYDCTRVGTFIGSSPYVISLHYGLKMGDNSPRVYMLRTFSKIQTAVTLCLNIDCAN
jgi:hypothetical protein